MMIEKSTRSKLVLACIFTRLTKSATSRFSPLFFFFHFFAYFPPQYYKKKILHGAELEQSLHKR